MKKDRTGQGSTLNAQCSMLNSLWLHLTLGFALVTLVSTLTVAIVANVRAETTFRGYLAQSQAADSGLVEQLADYYAQQGTWAGVETLLTAVPGPGFGRGRGQGHGYGGGAGMSSSLVLADGSGQVVADPAELVSAASLDAGARATALPIVVEGQTVGYLLARAARGAALPVAAQRFLDTLNQSLWGAGLLAGALGLGLGLLVARGLAAPLARLAGAARRLAQGRLDERVAVAGPVEVRAAGAAFNEMAAALEAGETQRRHMVADIAHELRTPLTVIQGNLRAILDEVYPLSLSEVATIYETTLGLRRLVDDLRDLSLAEAGRLVLHPRPVEVGPLLAHEAALFAEVAAGQGVTLHAAPAAELPAVLADPQRLAQVLHNLVSNALRHTPAGGHITLTATDDGQALPTTTPTSTTALAPHTPSVVIEVRDTGAGIAAADLPHIFDRFYRADRGRARETGGSGLGLAITAQLVRLQGGTIGVTSTPGAGSCFWVRLPLAVAAHVAPTSAGAAAR